MRRKVVPTANELREPGDTENPESSAEEDSGRGLLAAVSTRIVDNTEHERDEDNSESEVAPPEKLNKPMMSSVADIVDEGLGEDFEDTPWVPPSVKRAEDKRAQTIYRGGKSSIWDTRLHELEDMGIGVSLYFQFLKFLTGMYFMLTLLSIPSLVFAATGQGFPEASLFNKLVMTMVGNVGYPCDEDAVTTDFTFGCDSTGADTQHVFGRDYTHLEISYYITAFEFVGSVFSILAIVYWRWRTNHAVAFVDANKVTATDYAVYIEGLPKAAEMKDIGQFFSDLYQLAEADWKGRAPYQHAQPVFSVENTEDKWYVGKWIAEACVAREVGREVKAYKDKKDTVHELRKKRAEAKMYNEGTPLLEGNGADPAKFQKAVNAADKLGEAIAKTTDKIMDMRKDIDGKQACVGCFIVFNHPLSLHRCMEDFSSMGMFKKYPTDLMFEGRHKLKVLKAPEPDNIIWENLEFPKRKRAFRQHVTGLLSFVLLLISFALVLLATGIQSSFAEVVPKIAYCQNEVPALYFGNYSKSAAVADELALVRPDQSYREAEDVKCEGALGDERAVYMVYTVEEGEDRYLSPALNYSLDVCEAGSNICPRVGKNQRCPCATGANFEKCETLECSEPGGEPGGSCGEFVFATVSGCYCYDRLREGRQESNIISAVNSLRILDWDICGAFATAWCLAKVFNIIISFITPIINGILETCLTGLVAWEHNMSDDETATRLMYGVFQAQFVNTGILFLLVYGTAPSGFETPTILKDLQIFAGSYNDFGRDWQMVAGMGLLTSYILAAVTPHFGPLIAMFFTSKRRMRKAAKAVADETGEYVMQSELNDVFVGPVFDFTTRYSYLLTLVFVAMAYSGGMFAMNGLSFLFFLLTYWVDKMGILRFYARPPHREDALQRQVNNTLPWALLLHLCFTSWFLGTESLKSEVITESLPQLAPYKDVLTDYEAKFGVLVTRLIRTNVFPLVLLTVGVFVWCVLEFVGKFFPVLGLLGKGLRSVASICMGKKRTAAVMRPGRPIRSRWTSEVAAYTDVYFQYIPKDRDLTTAEKLEGWMVSHLADKSVVRKKGWDMDEEAPPAGRGDAKFSWEVIRDNSIFTYRIDLVPAYADIMSALKEEERLYKEDLAAESDDSNDSGGEAEGDEEDEGDASDDDEEDSEPLTRSARTRSKGHTAEKISYNPFDDFGPGAVGDDAEGSAGGLEDDYNPFSDFTDGVADVDSD